MLKPHLAFTGDLYRVFHHGPPRVSCGLFLCPPFLLWVFFKLQEKPIFANAYRRVSPDRMASFDDKNQSSTNIPPREIPGMLDRILFLFLFLSHRRWISVTSRSNKFSPYFSIYFVVVENFYILCCG